MACYFLVHLFDDIDKESLDSIRDCFNDEYTVENIVIAIESNFFGVDHTPEELDF